MHPTITSTANPLIRRLKSLHARKDRAREGLFLVEGRRELAMALAGGACVDTLVTCGELAPAPETRFPPRCTVQVSARVFGHLSHRENPDGHLAAFPLPPAATRALACVRPGGSRVYLFADQVEKPGNLGALLRCADALGVAAVLVPPATDMHSPHVIRNSVGTCFSVPWAWAAAEATEAWCRSEGVRIIVADPGGKVLPWQCSLSSAVLIVVGSEHAGVSGGWRRCADALVRIPQAGRADSLNVTAAAGMLLYESLRQRQAGGGS